MLETPHVVPCSPLLSGHHPVVSPCFSLLLVPFPPLLVSPLGKGPQTLFWQNLLSPAQIQLSQFLGSAPEELRVERHSVDSYNLSKHVFVSALFLVSPCPEPHLDLPGLERGPANSHDSDYSGGSGVGDRDLVHMPPT